MIMMMMMVMMMMMMLMMTVMTVMVMVMVTLMMVFGAHKHYHAICSSQLQNTLKLRAEGAPKTGSRRPTQNHPVAVLDAKKSAGSTEIGTNIFMAMFFSYFDSMQG